jgi:hypothetical protein
MVWTAILGALFLLVSYTVTDFQLSAQVSSNDNNISMMDNCLPGDPGWNPSGGCTQKPQAGDVSFAEFGQLLTSPLISGLVGHPSWRNEPSHLTSDRGRVKVTNRGGRAHTFTEVANFGGGSVAGFNIAMTRAPECPANPGLVQDALAPGASMTLNGLDSGLHKFQCCFHPWMRATVRVGGN